MTAENPTADRRVWQRGQRLLTAGLILVVTVAASESMAVATVMPLVERDLGDLWLYGWVFSAFFLGNLVGIVVAGRLADRMRVTVPFVAGLALFAGGLALGGLAPSMPVLVLARALQGLGAGAMPTVAYVCIGRGYTEAQRPRMFALLSTAWVVPSLLGPAAAGLVGERFGWRWVFGGLLPLVVGVGAIATRGVRTIATPASTGEQTSPRDALLVAVGASLLLVALGSENLVLGAVLGVGGLALGLPAFARLVPPGTLRARPGLPAAVLVRGVLTFAFFSADAYVPLTLTSVRGLSAVVAGLALTLASLTWTAGAWTQEREVHGRGPRMLVAVGFAVLVAGISAFAVVLVPSVPVWIAFLGWAIGGLGIGLAYAPISLTVLGTAGPGGEGRAASALQLSDVLGVALGTGVGGAIVAAGQRAGRTPAASLAPVYVMAAAIAVAGIILACRLPARLVSGAAQAVGSELDQDASVER